VTPHPCPSSSPAPSTPPSPQPPRQGTLRPAIHHGLRVRRRRGPAAGERRGGPGSRGPRRHLCCGPAAPRRVCSRGAATATHSTFRRSLNPASSPAPSKRLPPAPPGARRRRRRAPRVAHAAQPRPAALHRGHHARPGGCGRARPRPRGAAERAVFSRRSRQHPRSAAAAIAAHPHPISPRSTHHLSPSRPTRSHATHPAARDRGARRAVSDRGVRRLDGLRRGRRVPAARRAARAAVPPGGVQDQVGAGPGARSLAPRCQTWIKAPPVGSQGLSCPSQALAPTSRPMPTLHPTLLPLTRGRGWGVRSWDTIPCGALVAVFYGKVFRCGGRGGGVRAPAKGRWWPKAGPRGRVLSRVGCERHSPPPHAAPETPLQAQGRGRAALRGRHLPL
jgi:hypothetical protein